MLAHVCIKSLTSVEVPITRTVSGLSPRKCLTDDNNLGVTISYEVMSISKVFHCQSWHRNCRIQVIACHLPNNHVTPTIVQERQTFFQKLRKIEPLTAFHTGIMVERLKSLCKLLPLSSNSRHRSSTMEWPTKHMVWRRNKSSWTCKGGSNISGLVLSGISGVGQGKTRSDTPHREHEQRKSQHLAKSLVVDETYSLRWFVVMGDAAAAATVGCWRHVVLGSSWISRDLWKL